MKLTITASNKNRFKLGDPSTEFFVKSIQWQDFKDFELLIADGGSDNYEEIKNYFANHDGPIPMRIVQYKIGDVFLRALLNNVGVRNAKGEYVACTDVDMLYGREFVSTAVKLMSPKRILESRTMYWKKPLVKQIYKGKLDPYTDLDACKVGRIKKRTTAGGFQCMHRDSWAKVQYDEAFYGWGSEDYDLLKRCKKAGLKEKWLGENRESIMLFHQPHGKNTKRDLVFQEENKKILNSIKEHVNKNGWGGVYDE